MTTPLEHRLITRLAAAIRTIEQLQEQIAMTGFKTKVTNVKLKDGKVIAMPKKPRSVSEAIRQKKSKRVKVVRKP